VKNNSAKAAKMVTAVANANKNVENALLQAYSILVST